MNEIERVQLFDSDTAFIIQIKCDFVPFKISYNFCRRHFYMRVRDIKSLHKLHWFYLSKIIVSCDITNSPSSNKYIFSCNQNISVKLTLFLRHWICLSNKLKRFVAVVSFCRFNWIIVVRNRKTFFTTFFSLWLSKNLQLWLNQIYSRSSKVVLEKLWCAVVQ